MFDSKLHGHQTMKNKSLLFGSVHWL